MGLFDNDFQELIDMARSEFAAGSDFNPPIVVGMDGGAPSLAALAWAHDEAAAHDAPLVVVHAVDPRSHAATYAPVSAGVEQHAEVAGGVKALIGIEALSRVEHVCEVGVPSAMLVERSRGARMLVLGQSAHHHDPVRPGSDSGRLEPSLGAVSRACMALAECPVVVVTAAHRA